MQELEIAQKPTAAVAINEGYLIEGERDCGNEAF
jgi:hypothetical protein